MPSELDAANQKIAALQSWQASATVVLNAIHNARDAGMMDADRQRYLGKGTEDVIADLWVRVRSGEAAERKLVGASGKLRDIRSNANVNHPDLKWLIEFIRDYADKAIAQIEQPHA